ncbi:MAG: hypothetical protein JNJ58_03860 [Chitinophagaceae bacterium]|nr:hypothetical protein [Chitinophagaceae bacterium]
MKKIIPIKYLSLLLCCFIQLGSLHAQTNTSKIQLTKGQTFLVTSIDSSDTKQKRGEDNMDMKSFSVSTIAYEVLEVKENSYLIRSTLQKIKINSDAFGMKMDYDSEDPAKQEGMFAEQIKGRVGKSDTLEIGMDGKKIEKEEKEKKPGNGRGGRGGMGMMGMMKGQSGGTENLFLLIPAEATEGKGWKVDDGKENIRTQTIYFMDKVEGNTAQVSFKRKKKGTRTFNGQGGEGSVDIDNLSEGSLTVNLSTGLVSAFKETVNINMKTLMMGQESPSTGVSVSVMEVR